MRTKVFVSYSHADRDWMDRLKLHLTVLERRGLVDVWSDVRIEVGAGWEEEIESALTEARVAVLLVSPAFLASSYVWDHEMPRIIAHQKAGMRVLPMVARPCAWRLADELTRLQARPTDGRPLSTGTDAQIDLDLAAFVYEIAGIVGALPNALATDEWERIATQGTVPSAGKPAAEGMYTPSAASRAVSLATLWRGDYPETGARMTLRIDQQVGADFTGSIEYDHGALTAVAGRVRSDTQALGSDAGWRGIGPPGEAAVTFRELRTMREGRQAISLDGEYRAFLAGDRMSGGWFSAGIQRGTFVFKAATSPASQ